MSALCCIRPCQNSSRHMIICYNTECYCIHKRQALSNLCAQNFFFTFSTNKLLFLAKLHFFNILVCLSSLCFFIQLNFISMSSFFICKLLFWFIENKNIRIILLLLSFAMILSYCFNYGGKLFKGDYLCLLNL